MNFNATLIGQTIAFIVFVWICMKYIWPPLMSILEERTAKIAEGLAAARRALVVQPIAIAGTGLLLAALSGVVSILFGDAFLTGQWWFPSFAPDMKYASTVVLFDVGVYLVVVGAIAGIAFALEGRE